MYSLSYTPPVNLLSTLSDRMLSEPINDRLVRAAACSCVLVLCLSGHADPVAAQSLRGSTASLDLQNRIARQHDFTYIDTPSRVRFFADRGWLVRIEPNDDFDLHAVSFPYARPEVDLFIRRLSSQYRRACDERLVVTSLTRPTTRQPRNASDRSVHPTGMALDLRYSWDRNCRRWLENVLTTLERQRVLEATLERNPRHYHIALFPSQYAGYVERLVERRTEEAPQARTATAEAAETDAETAATDTPAETEARTTAAATPATTDAPQSEAGGPQADAAEGGAEEPEDQAEAPAAQNAASPPQTLEYRVRKGDSLWRIAREHGVSVDELRIMNGISGNRIMAGQVLDVPLGT